MPSKPLSLLAEKRVFATIKNRLQYLNDIESVFLVTLFLWHYSGLCQQKRPLDTHFKCHFLT